MVCRPASDDEEEFALCVVRDFSGTSHDLKVNITASSKMTGKDFVREVAKLFNFEPNSFRLVSPTPAKQNHEFQATLTEESEELLKDVGVNFETNARNLFIVEGLSNGVPRLVKDDDLELGASASPDEPSSSSSFSPPLRRAVCSYKLNPDSSLKGKLDSPQQNQNYGDWNPGSTAKPRRRYRGRFVAANMSFDSPCSLGYRGLINQAMTCYLNSLLQALYMTPEFRNALYNWKFVPSPGMDEYKSIPYQLQKLFLNLQTAHRTAVETTDLTRSFGWDSSEAWQQHDIQELCRVMFDALEQEFKGTEQADLINRLYQGKMIDYVKCLDCGTEKNREDTFLDIPLPVRPFGCNVAYGSVEEALNAFVQPETLEENNQYFCERCNRKCDAHKGLKFSKFPYLLTLHLMRFDFDYNSMHRIKLSDKVVFPETLNLNGFIAETSLSPTLYKEEGSEGFPEEIAGSSSKCDDSSTTDSGSAIDDEGCLASSNDLNNVDYDQDVDEGIDVGNQHENEKNRNHSMDSGPYVYELFSIMVHSGSATGGHYYVYIKDFQTGDWFCFNDQSVTRITHEDIDRSFGGYGGPSRSYYSGVYSSSMNAYMLMYRQIDRERNVLPLKEEEFPPHIKALLNEMYEKEETNRRIQDKLRETRKVKLFVQYPESSNLTESKLECSSTLTLKQVTFMAYKKLQLENLLPEDHCRLVLYNSKCDSVEDCLEGRELDDIGSILNVDYSGRKNEMLMEVRTDDAPFVSYKPGAVSIRLFQVHFDSEKVDGPLVLRTSLKNDVATFRDELFERYKMVDQIVYIALFTEGGTVRSLEDETLPLQDAGVVAGSQIFIGFPPNPSVPRKKMRCIIERYLNVIRLNIMLPEIKSEVYKRLSIPTLSEYTKNQKPEEIQLSNKDTYRMNNSVNNSLITNNNNLLPSLLSSPPMNGEDAFTNETSQTVSSIPVGGHQSDQSASEDSSLTDSDRTLMGEAQEDCHLSSAGSSPRHGNMLQISSAGSSPRGCDLRYSNELLCDDANCEDKFNKFTCNYDDDSEVCDLYFKECSNTVSFDKRNLKVDVDKRMPIEAFKKHLEQYVQVPSPFFKLLCTPKCDTNSSTNNLYVTNLNNVSNDATIRVHLRRLTKPGLPKTNLFYLNLGSNKIIEFLGEFVIDEDSTVAETKKELLQDLRIVQNIDIPFERCRLREKTDNGPGRIYLNDQMWKDITVPMGCSRELYLQALENDDPIVDTESQTAVIVRLSNGSLTEIVVDELTVQNLKAKIAVISNIPEEHLLLGSQAWGTSNYYQNNIDWTSMTNESATLDQWPLNLREEGHVINFKDGRDEANRLEPETRHYNTGKCYNARLANRKMEKSLKIQVSAPRITNGDMD